MNMNSNIDSMPKGTQSTALRNDVSDLSSDETTRSTTEARRADDRNIGDPPSRSISTWKSIGQLAREIAEKQRRNE